MLWGGPRAATEGVGVNLLHGVVFIAKLSERPLLRDVGKMHLKYDGLSPTVIGHDLNPAGA